MVIRRGDNGMARNGADDMPEATSRTRRRRARIRGGDVPRGAAPLGLGHAGKGSRGIALMLAMVLAVLLATLGPVGSPARAETGSEYWDYNTMGNYVIYADFYTTKGNKGYCVEYERHGPKGVTYTKWFYTGEVSASVARCDPHALAWLATRLYPVDSTMGGRSPDNPQKASQLAVWMLQGDCSYSGVTTLGVDAVGDGATRNDVNVAAALAREALGHAGESGTWDRASKVWIAPDSDHQNMLEVIPMGTIELVKASAQPGITEDNDCYDLSGARYVVYSDQACSNAVETLVTDASGKAASGPLPAGKYWVREEGASKGFGVDISAHGVVVESGKSSRLSCTEVPLRYRLPILLTKVDADGSPVAQGAASLAGAKLEVSLYRGSYDATSLPSSPWRRWTVTTDAGGTAVLDTTVVKDDLLVQDGKVSLPLGTIVVRELEPPEGYVSLDAPLVAHIQASSGEARLVAVGGWRRLGEVGDAVIRGGISVRKADTQTDDEAQGDATLEGALFSIVNQGPGPVVVNGETHASDEEVMRIRTDASGVATTGDGVLPYGTYLVNEVAAPEGYLLGNEWSQVVEVRGDQTVSLVEEPCLDDVVRGGLRVGKVSRETMAHSPQGGASLSGASLEVTLLSDQAVVVDGSTYQRGEVVATLVTDRDGYTQTEDHALPYGTYEVREVVAPTGYELNDQWSQVVEVREDGRVYDLSAEEDSVPDQVMRGGLRFNKVDAQTMAAVGRCAFLVTSDTTGEAHVVVTDENGEFDSERVGHDVRTNANDVAVTVDEDGAETIDDELLDADAGLWFSGDPARPVDPYDDLALPYDTYTVRELRCAANEGLGLVSFKVFVTRDAHAIARGTVSDELAPEVRTRLLHEGEREAPATTVTLTDIVTCTGLRPGVTYVVTGTLHDAGTGAQVGNPSSVELRASRSEESVEVPIEVDLSQLAGESVVAFEDLSLDGEVVARHADLESEDQTIPVVKPQREPDPKPPSETTTEVATPPAATPAPTPRTADDLPAAGMALCVAGVGSAALAVRAIMRRRRLRATRRAIY